MVELDFQVFAVKRKVVVHDMNEKKEERPSGVGVVDVVCSPSVCPIYRIAYCAMAGVGHGFFF